ARPGRTPAPCPRARRPRTPFAGQPSRPLDATDGKIPPYPRLHSLIEGAPPSLIRRTQLRHLLPQISLGLRSSGPRSGFGSPVQAYLERPLVTGEDLLDRVEVGRHRAVRGAHVTAGSLGDPPAARGGLHRHV